jgi:hypothetical protein
MMLNWERRQYPFEHPDYPAAQHRAWARVRDNIQTLGETLMDDLRAGGVITTLDVANRAVRVLGSSPSASGAPVRIGSAGDVLDAEFRDMGEVGDGDGDGDEGDEGDEALGNLPDLSGDEQDVDLRELQGFDPDADDADEQAALDAIDDFGLDAEDRP